MNFQKLNLCCSVIVSKTSDKDNIDNGASKIIGKRRKTSISRP